MSLGQWRDKQQLLADMQELNNQGLTLEFDVNEVCLIARQEYLDPFTVQYAIPLGSATDAAVYKQPQQINVPYIATTAACLQQLLPVTHPLDKARFGIGSAPNNIWNFAYGANMNPNKLGGSRGLHPLNSKPGVLRGYTLAFNHRGGFGNLVPVDSGAATVAATALTQGSDLLQEGTARAVYGVQAAEAAQAHKCSGAAEIPANALNTAEHATEATALTRNSTAQPAAAPATLAPEMSTAQQPVPCEVHGVLHQLTPKEMATLMGMEHEYWPVEVAVEPYPVQQQQHHFQHNHEMQQRGALAQQDAQQQRTLAVAFISPPNRCIARNLPPIRRYHSLLVEGAKHWQLDKQYASWLASHPSIPAHARGDEYYKSPEGVALQAWPKTRTGSLQGSRSGRSRRGRQ
eukprot:GHRR01000341.1.p1 GENE.GHRR01000341.1~~GHRR01000341.1.p1  ORF type:complete len:403 (+),score=155.35 GHRR01000341.1:2385-3593(+)